MSARQCLMCTKERLATSEDGARGPYCDACWLKIATECFTDYLLERIAEEGASVEHLRQNPPSNAELMQIFINLWEVKHTFRSGEVVQP